MASNSEQAFVKHVTRARVSADLAGHVLYILDKDISKDRQRDLATARAYLEQALAMLNEYEAPEKTQVAA